MSCFCRCFENTQASSLGKFQNIFFRNLPLGYLRAIRRATALGGLRLALLHYVIFIGKNDDLYIWLRMVVNFFKPIV